MSEPNEPVEGAGTLFTQEPDRAALGVLAFVPHEQPQPQA
jgi:hypothetical protein